MAVLSESPYTTTTTSSNPSSSSLHSHGLDSDDNLDDTGMDEGVPLLLSNDDFYDEEGEALDGEDLLLPWLVSTVATTTLQSTSGNSQTSGQTISSQLTNRDPCLFSLVSELGGDLPLADFSLTQAQVEHLGPVEQVEQSEQMQVQVQESAASLPYPESTNSEIVESPLLSSMGHYSFGLSLDQDPIPSSPSIPLKRTGLKDVTNLGAISSKMMSLGERKCSTPKFSHWSLNTSQVTTTTAANPFAALQSSVPMPKLRRAVSEFTQADSSHLGNKSEVSMLINSTIGTNHVLPCHDSAKDAIKRITPSTLLGVIRGDYAHTYNKAIIVDCRYPYEYHGGHIPGAINVSSLEQIDQILFCDQPEPAHHTVVIFHCEFSSERAPRMALHVRNRDRVLNADHYPHLHYPQLYILEGGYKNFFTTFPAACDPPHCYLPMRHNECREELKHHQKLKFHDAQINGKHRHKLRSASLRRAHSISAPHPATAVSTFLTQGSRMVRPCPTALDLLSSDAGDIFEDSNGILQAAEHVLLAAPLPTPFDTFDSGRLSQ